MGCICQKQKIEVKQTGNSVNNELEQGFPNRPTLFVVKEEPSFNEQSYVPSKVASYAPSQRHSIMAQRKSPEPFRESYPS